MSDESILKLVEMLSRSIEVEQKLCEQRITLFLSIATITLGGVNIVHEFGPGWQRFSTNEFHWTVLFILIVLLVYGLHTLNRFNWRFIHIEVWRLQITHALAGLSNPLINGHLEIRDRFNAEVRRTRLFGRIQGTPAEFMYITNALLLSGIFLNYFQWKNWYAYDTISSCIVIFIASFVIFWFPFNRIRHRMLRLDGDPQA